MPECVTSHLETVDEIALSHTVQQHGESLFAAQELFSGTRKIITDLQLRSEKLSSICSESDKRNIDSFCIYLDSLVTYFSSKTLFQQRTRRKKSNTGLQFDFNLIGSCSCVDSPDLLQYDHRDKEDKGKVLFHLQEHLLDNKDLC
jgi:hypothetical protein